MAQQVREGVHAKLGTLLRGIPDVQRGAQAGNDLAELLTHLLFAAIGRQLTNVMNRLPVCQMGDCWGPQRMSPEWCWRDFRLRMGHHRNDR